MQFSQLRKWKGLRLNFEHEKHAPCKNCVPPASLGPRAATPAQAGTCGHTEPQGTCLSRGSPLVCTEAALARGGSEVKRKTCDCFLLLVTQCSRKANSRQPHAVRTLHERKMSGEIIAREDATTSQLFISPSRWDFKGHWTGAGAPDFTFSSGMALLPSQMTQAPKGSGLHMTKILEQSSSRAHPRGNGRTQWYAARLQDQRRCPAGLRIPTHLRVSPGPCYCSLGSLQSKPACCHERQAVLLLFPVTSEEPVSKILLKEAVTF